MKRENSIQVAIMTCHPSVTPNLENQLLRKLHQGFLFLRSLIRCEDTATTRSQCSGERDGLVAHTCELALDGHCPKKHGVQCEPAQLLRFEGTAWNHVGAFKGK